MTATLLIVSQVYVPDTPSVGQHLHDVAKEMVRRGYRVIVYASRRSYEDASQVFPRKQVLDGVEVVRLPLSSLGKRSIVLRLVGGVLFVCQAMVRGLFTRKLCHILISTSPPVAPVAALFIQWLRGTPITFWAMDINPDQMVAIGKLPENARSVRLLNAVYRAVLERAQAVVTLDEYMAERLEAKAPLRNRLAVMPPWPHDSVLQAIATEDNPFRDAHGLAGKRVIMYSGNLSPVHPLDTLLEAARQVQDDERLVFFFIGGGLGMKAVAEYVERYQVANIRTLPYQPLDRIRYSLSAADVHVVSVGPAMVGIVHPCKIYAAMSLGRPVLLLGPARSHAGDILNRYPIGWRVDHGAVDQLVSILREVANCSQDELAARGAEAQCVSRDVFSMANLLKCFGDVLEHGVTCREPHVPVIGQTAFRPGARHRLGSEDAQPASAPLAEVLSLPNHDCHE